MGYHGPPAHGPPPQGHHGPPHDPQGHHVHEGKRLYKCNTCNTSLASMQGLITHEKAIHKGEKLFKCDECGLKHTLKNQLTQHIRQVHEGKKQDNGRRAHNSSPHK